MLLIMIKKTGLTFEWKDKILKNDHSMYLRYRAVFSVVLIATLKNVVLTFESVNEILKWYH